MPALVLLALGLLSALGCGTDQRVVARESAPATEEDAGSPELQRPRGRPSIVDGRLVTDIGTPLRGLMAPLDVGWTLEQFDLLTEVAETTGLDAVHVFLENYTDETGTRKDAADAIVSLTAGAGLYVVLGIGGGEDAEDHPGNGWFDPAKVESFWRLYGARYANSPHVLFEIQNNPEITCSDPVKPETVELERSTYALIRDLAPDTHVVLYSFSSVPEAPVLDDAIVQLGDVVDWSNASVAFHANSDCASLEDFAGVSDVAAAQGVALLASQLPPTGWEPWVDAFEQAGVGWLHHQWLAFSDDLADFRQQTTAAELSWCPDQGTFPEDASECRTP